METNIIGLIAVFLASYPGLIISILAFCVSIIILIIKRKTLSKVIKTLLLIMAIISASFIGFSVYFAIAFGRNHSVGIIDGSDNPKAIYITESNNDKIKLSNIQWILDDAKIMSSEINGKLVKNNIEYENIIMIVIFEKNKFIFKIYENKKISVLGDPTYQIDNGKIKYEKGIVSKNNLLEIEEEIMAPFLLMNEEFEIIFSYILNRKTESYNFKLKGNNFFEVWSQINGKNYEHLPVWEGEY